MLKADNSGSGAVKLTVSAKGELVPYTGGRAGEGVGGATNSDPYYGGDAPAATSGGGTSGGGGTTSSAPAVTGPQDWSATLGIYGLPSDVQAKVNQIFSNTSDVNQATALAMAYIRGTSWYAQTYPGIQTGIAKGVVGNEADYRSYLNQIQQLTQQYYGRDVTSDELASYLNSGYDVNHVGRVFQGAATATANGADWRYLTGAFGGGPISNSDATTLGQQQAGLDSALGQKLQNQITKAQQKMQRVFSGTLASPSLSQGAAGPVAAGLAGRGPTPDVAA